MSFYCERFYCVPGGGGGGGGPLTIFVGGIPRHLTSRAVEKKFLQFGPIDSVRKPGPGNYAFIQYKNGEAAKIAVDKGHTLFRGENVTVEFSHTREGTRGRASSGRRTPRRKSIVAKRAAAIKKKALRGKKRKVTARDRRESDRDRSPLVLLRRGQRSPSLIGGRTPERSRRRSSVSPDDRSPVERRRRRSSVDTLPDTPDDDDHDDRSPIRKSRSPMKSRRRSTGSPKRRWSSSLSPGASPSRSWSRSASPVGSESPPVRHSYHYSRSPSPDHLSDRSRSSSPVFKRRKKKGRPSTPSDPSPPLSYRSSLSSRSPGGLSRSRSRSRSFSPVSRKMKRNWERRDYTRTMSPSPGHETSPAMRSPLGKKRKRNRGPRKSRKRGGKGSGGPTRTQTQVRRESSGGVKKKKRPPKGIRLKLKARDKEGRMKVKDTSKPVSLLDIDVKPAIRPLMDLTPIRRPPSPRERPPSPRPLLSRGRSMSMSPTPSPHRQPLEPSYRRSPSPNYSYGGYRGGLYYRQQEASVMNYRGEMNSGGYKGGGGYGSGYGSSWDRNRMLPAPLMSSNYSMAPAGSYRSRTPPRRR